MCQSLDERKFVSTLFKSISECWIKKGRSDITPSTFVQSNLPALLRLSSPSNDWRCIIRPQKWCLLSIRKRIPPNSPHNVDDMSTYLSPVSITSKECQKETTQVCVTCSASDHRMTCNANEIGIKCLVSIYDFKAHQGKALPYLGKSWTESVGRLNSRTQLAFPVEPKHHMSSWSIM